MLAFHREAPLPAAHTRGPLCLSVCLFGRLHKLQPPKAATHDEPSGRKRQSTSVCPFGRTLLIKRIAQVVHLHTHTQGHDLPVAEIRLQLVVGLNFKVSPRLELHTHTHTHNAPRLSFAGRQSATKRPEEEPVVLPTAPISSLQPQMLHNKQKRRLCLCLCCNCRSIQIEFH